MEHPLGNITPSGKSKFRKPSGKSKSKKLSVNSKSVGPSVKSKSGAPAAKAMMRIPSAELKLGDPSVKCKPGSPFAKSGYLSVKSEVDDPSVMSQPIEPPPKSESGGLSMKSKSDDRSVNSRYQLRNIKNNSGKASGKCDSDKSPVNPKSSGPAFQAELKNPPMISKLGDPSVKPKPNDPAMMPKTGYPSVKPKPGDPSEKLKPGDPSEKFRPGDPSKKLKPGDASEKLKPGDSFVKPKLEGSSIKYRPDDPSVKCKWIDLSVKSKTIKSCGTFKSDECKLTAEIAEELAFVNKKFLKTESDSGQQPPDIIDQFISTRKLYLIFMHNDFIVADSFNSSADKCLSIENVFKIRTNTPDDVSVWHRFHEYWYRFKHKFNIMNLKLNHYFPRSARNDQLQSLGCEPFFEVHYIDSEHFPRTKDEYDHFLSTMVDVYNIINNILSICYNYFDGCLRYYENSKERLFSRYLSKLRSYLSPLSTKLKIEIYECKMFEIKARNKLENSVPKFT